MTTTENAKWINKQLKSTTSKKHNNHKIDVHDSLSIVHFNCKRDSCHLRFQGNIKHVKVIQNSEHMKLTWWGGDLRLRIGVDFMK